MNNMFSMFNTFNMFGNTKKKYNPYINYTWEMLPNAKVKNSGTSGVDLQLYSGNPLDFQGSQYIDISSSNIATQQNQSISFRCKSDVTTSAVILGWQQNSTYLYTENNMYKVRILGTIFELYPQSANGNYCVLTYNFQDKSFMFYVDGIKVYTSANNAADFSYFLINYVGCGYLSSTTRRYLYDGQLDYVIITNSILTQEQITQSVEQPNQFFKDMSTNSNTLFCTDFRGNGNTIKAYKSGTTYPITNYSTTQRSNFTQVNKGLQDLTRSFDSNGFFVDNVSYLNCNGKGKATIVEPSRTSNITIKTNPTTLSGNILSGGVIKTTTGLTSGVDNDIVLSNQVISSNIDIGVGFIGKISVYTEDKLS